MRFGKTLEKSRYGPWKDQYIDYAKLKKLLRERDFVNDSPHQTEIDAPEWTQQDEEAFVEELVNVQLEKVNLFQKKIYEQLEERTSQCENKLEGLNITRKQDNEYETGDHGESEVISREQYVVLEEVLKELKDIDHEIQELQKYSRINFTGFLKAAKKHDRKRGGSQYRVRPLLQVRLAALPFNSEDYSPLSYKTQAMTSFVLQNISDRNDDTTHEQPSNLQAGVEQYESHKFWVHPDNVLELKTYILRRLPALVYNSQVSKVADGSQKDPTITSLYFDNSNFDLYSGKVGGDFGASSLRLRWFGQLDDSSDIAIEKKSVQDDGESSEIKILVKEKYIQAFLQGKYKLEKQIQKLEALEGKDASSTTSLKSNVQEIYDMISSKGLQPMLRANYARTAFQIPGDDRIRISLDTNLALIREDSLDMDRPCRDPDDWHRKDIDESELEYPFSTIRKGEIVRFPYAILNIKVKEDIPEQSKEWLSDLMSSHLVKETPRFSKFVHGVTQLFEKNVNTFPFWIQALETDIRRDPATAFEEEQEKKAKRLQDELAVGSFIGSRSSPAFRPAVGSPARQMFLEAGATLSGSGLHVGNGKQAIHKNDTPIAAAEESDVDDAQVSPERSNGTSNFRFVFPSFSISKYARAHQKHIQLPTGVKAPAKWIKDSGPVHVEAKVWLANQRTFIKWQHIAVLLGTLSIALYNAAGPNNRIARHIAIVYILIAVFSGAWGWWMYTVRSRLIRERSGQDFDNVLGPIVVCFALFVALCINFFFQYNTAMGSRHGSVGDSQLSEGVASSSHIPNMS